MLQPRFRDLCVPRLVSCRCTPVLRKQPLCLSSLLDSQDPECRTVVHRDPGTAAFVVGLLVVSVGC